MNTEWWVGVMGGSGCDFLFVEESPPLPDFADRQARSSRACTTLLNEDIVVSARNLESRAHLRWYVTYFGDKNRCVKHQFMENRVYRLYVGGLPANVSIEELQLRFARFGEVQEVHMPDEKFPSCADRPANRGFAFISLCTTEIKVKNCITTYSGCLWRGSRLHIANALPDFNERFQFRPHEWGDIIACEQIKVGYFSAS